MDADEKIRRIADTLKVRDYEPFIRRAADDFYERLLYAVQEYLRSNVEWNLQADIDSLRGRVRALEEYLRDVSEALGVSEYDHEARIRQIDFLKRRVALTTAATSGGDAQPSGGDPQ